MQSNEPQIEDLLSILKGEVNNKKSKNVDILHLSSIIVRRMSGKDTVRSFKAPLCYFQLTWGRIMRVRNYSRLEQTGKRGAGRIST